MPRLTASLLLFLAFFALYAFTAQRGLGWGDSGQFQAWILGDCDFGVKGFSNLHPLYVATAKIFARTPYAVTLVSSFFGALAVAGVALCCRSIGFGVLFGLSHMVWWLSCVAEVQTMNLAFTAFETLAFLKWLECKDGRWFVAMSALAGLHLEIHNFALLALPVYAAAALVRRIPFRTAAAAALAFCICASYWLYAFFTRGPADVLVGAYSAKVAGFMPGDWKTAAFNFALAGLSFAVPAVLAICRGFKRSPFMLALFGINALFFARYFVPDQATFLLPTLFFAYLMIRDTAISAGESLALSLVQIILPVAAFCVLLEMPQDAKRAERHPYRDDAAYFALPYKFFDHSADRCAAELGGVWDGYNAERMRR